MIYQVLFLVNRGTSSLVLTVKTTYTAPDPSVVQNAELLLVPEPATGFSAINLGIEGLQVLKDRPGLFRQRQEIPESLVLAWIQAGCGVLGPQYQALLQYF